MAYIGPELRIKTNIMPGFEETEGGFQVPGPYTDTYMIASIDAPVFDTRSSADRSPRFRSDPLSAASHTGLVLLKAALGEGKII